MCVLLTKMWMTAPSQSDLSGQCLQKLLQMCGAAADSFKAVQKTAALFAFDGLVQLPCKSIPFHPLDTATHIFLFLFLFAFVLLFPLSFCLQGRIPQLSGVCDTYHILSFDWDHANRRYMSHEKPMG